MAEGSCKIFICDDSLLIRKKLKQSLELFGQFEIVEISNGREAVDAYKVHKPDLVFMDVVMPEVDGIEALTLIREFDNTAYVVIVSSTGTQSNFKKAIDAGAADFIQKPWKDSQIHSIVEKVIKKRGEANV